MLINVVRELGGLSFLAHPNDPAAPAFHETDISWADWSVTHFTGIELWNGLSELKTMVPTKLHGVLYAFFPELLHFIQFPQRSVNGMNCFRVIEWLQLVARMLMPMKCILALFDA